MDAVPRVRGLLGRGCLRQRIPLPSNRFKASTRSVAGALDQTGCSVPQPTSPVAGSTLASGPSKSSSRIEHSRSKRTRPRSPRDLNRKPALRNDPPIDSMGAMIDDDGSNW
jgi:hypothetical protein